MTEKVLYILAEETNIPKSAIRVDFKGIQKNPVFTWVEHLIMFGWTPRLSMLEDKKVLTEAELKWKEELESALQKAEKLHKETNIFFFEINYQEETFMGWTTEDEILINRKVKGKH